MKTFRDGPPASATILIVDDNPTNIGVLFDILGSNGLRRLVARDGESALETAVNKRPDLILLDILMPGISGYETCRRLKETAATRDIPIIFMTALSDTVDKVKGLELGAVDYITKPIHHEEAMARINLQLELKAAQQRLREKSEELEARNGELAMRNEELARTARELRESGAMRDKFFALMARDIKTPLVALMCNAEGLRDGAGGMGAEAVVRMAGEQWRMADGLFRLLQNINDWAVCQMGRVACSLRPLRLRKAVEDALAEGVAKMAAAKRVEVVDGVDEEMMALADAKLLQAVLRNVLGNAVKYSLRGGRVLVSAQVIATAEGDGGGGRGGRVELVVADEGIGMATATRERLFRLDAPESTPGTAGEPGTGLGLLVCREYLAVQRGTISVESGASKGVTVRVRLPGA